MEISITRPITEDIPVLGEFFFSVIRDTFDCESIDDAYAHEIQEEAEKQLATLRRDILSNGADEYFLIARAGGKIVGTIAYGPANEDIRNHIGIELENTPEVKSAYVLPEYQGRGVGITLFHEIVEHLRRRSIDAICLDCGYVAAQRFWKNLLGEPTIVIRDKWGIDAHYMIWHCRLDELRRRS